MAPLPRSGETYSTLVTPALMIRIMHISHGSSELTSV